MGIAQHDLGPHADEPIQEEQPALVHLLVKENGPLRLRRGHEGDAHEIRGKGGPGAVLHPRNGVAEVGADLEGLLTRNHQVATAELRDDPESLEHGERHAKIVRPHVLDHDVVSRERPENDEAADLHEVRTENEVGPRQCPTAPDGEEIGPDTFDLGSHRLQQDAEPLHMRLGRRVAQDRGPLGQHRGQDHVLRRRHAGLVQQDVLPVQAGCRQGQPVGIRLHRGPESHEAHHVRIDAPAPDPVAPGLSELRPALSGEKRAHENERAADLSKEVGVRPCRLDGSGVQGDGMRVVSGHRHAEALDEGEHGSHVLDVGQIAQGHGLAGEERGGHGGEGRVLVAARANPSLQSGPSVDHELCHYRVSSGGDRARRSGRSGAPGPG